MGSIGRSLNQMFAHCQRLRLEFGLMQQAAQEVKDISMNASVVARQIGSNGRACSEIAHQIADVAKRMEIQTERMANLVNSIVNQTLSALREQTRMGKYQMALPAVHGAGNLQLLSSAILRLMEQIDVNLQGNSKSIYRMQASLRTLQCYQFRLCGALNTLKVESAALQGTSTSSLSSLSESLQNIVEAIFVRIEDLASNLRILQTRNLMIKQNIYFLQGELCEDRDAA